MTEAVIDTNVLVSAVLTPRGPSGEVVDLALAGEVCPVFDDRILAEYAQVLTRSSLCLPLPLVSSLLNALQTAGRRVVVTAARVRLPDESDRCFYECALAAGTHILVTGNKKHFPGASGAGIVLLSPREFLDRLRH